MKKFWLWFGVFMCAGLTIAGISAFFTDLSAGPDVVFHELLIAIVCGLCTVFLVLKAVRPGWRLLPESRKIDENTPLPVVKTPRLMLSRGEICHLEENVKLGKVKTVTTRAVSHSGGSVRIAKGLSIRTGTSTSRPIQKNMLDVVPGTLYVTNKRIVASSSKYNFDKPLSALSSYTMYTDGFSLQFGNDSYTFLVRDRVYIATIVTYLANIRA